MKKILIVEDEFAISQVLKAYLTKQNYEVVQCYTGSEAIEVFEKECPDLVLLDIMLPGKNGWVILKEIRSLGSCPVIMLTALGDVNFRLEGFGEGADDYISKPFIADEVVARVKAVLRRVSSEEPLTMNFGKLHIDFIGHSVRLDGKEIFLTPRDLSVLLFLAKQPNQTFTRDQLIEHIWGWDYDGSDRAVDLSIKRLRKALADWSADEGEIRTLRGLGYQFNVRQK
ncbi:response regulator transcription factor [Psychrobacillus lasiicapitis]|uniref:Response regulator transcription factor n=1 Tax=Psychrobacillus lasiicapitis TaxID=1636719 RepID=A0A544T4X2_9BACI|nr:response regulator transcription factor [Psychrobacillus lasiicapitis]TQR12494.1 response regulator transcription factor [Psychrobacillus lasiicapitis]GGA38587.1 DNA-binding response regulator [Psychrobacillus lasiicapitis]